MLDFIATLPSEIYNHYHGLTGIVLVVAILKVVFPPFMYLLKKVTEKVMEKRSARRFMKNGMPEDEALKLARSIWRPDKKRPFLVRMVKKLSSYKQSR